MDSPIEITLLSTTPDLTFRLATGEGGTPQVAQFIVSDVLTRRPVWWLVSRAWADAVSFRPMWIDFLPDSAPETRTDSGFDNEVDLIEDLPPSDPRHQAALRGPVDPIEDLPASDARHQDALRRLDIDTLGLRQPLALVTYGVVPSGFREAYPGTGAPRATTGGGSYVLFVDGLISEGKMAFSLP
jgi:hypothetical protein